MSYTENPAMGYRDLEIYRLAHELAVRIHHMSLELPSYEKFETGSQIRRSSKSVSANIVEGFCRKRYAAEFIRFLIYAHGSCNETIEHIELLMKTSGNHSSEQLVNLKNEYEILGAKMNRFLKGFQQSVSRFKTQNTQPKTHNVFRD